MTAVPMPLIVGAPRSGTTMLRFMLDAHPVLAIPPETGFLTEARRLDDAGVGAEEFVDVISRFPPDAPAWGDFGVEASALRAELAALPVFTVASGLRAFYRAYAASHGKSRWGDKTPGYALHVADIAAVLPEAHVIHLIRDGRDVATSLRKRWFSPGHAIDVQAAFWARHVEAARAAGRALPGRYVEVRYEQLVADPEPVLRDLCARLDLAFDPVMLRPHERAPERLGEHHERRRTDGTLVVSRAERLDQQRMTTEPPGRSRVGVWREELTADDVTGFHAVAGDLLTELGYLEPPQPAGWRRLLAARRP